LIRNIYHYYLALFSRLKALSMIESDIKKGFLFFIDKIRLLHCSEGKPPASTNKQSISISHITDIL